MKAKIKNLLITLALLSTFNVQLSTAFAQGTAFTYQGRLNDGVNPANGYYDLQFILFNVSQFGFPVGPILTNASVLVNNGLSTATLDFGAGIFVGSNYWLEISARTNGGGAFTALIPRQPVTPTPYAVFAESVGSGGVAAGTYANAVTFNNTANNFSGAFTGNGAGVTNVNAATLGGLSSSSFWKLGGNTGTNPTNGNFIGTTDNLPLELRANGLRALRLEAIANDANHSNIVNVVNGSSVNYVSNGVVGATISGGGASHEGGLFAITNSVTANFGTVGGGNSDTASGNYSFAAGTFAHAAHDGSFVWADNNFDSFSSTTVNQFRVRATGGVAFATAIDGSGSVTAGVHLLSGDTAWSSISDKNAKKNFRPVNDETILEKLAAIPVEQWNYKWESDGTVPHLGPMAQDFKSAFYLGRDDKSISTLEFDGMELAAIKGLNEKLEDRSRKLEAENAELKQRLDALEKIIRDRN